MPFIKGIDNEGKELWLQESGYWGEKLAAKNFTPAQAESHRAEIAKRNAYARSHDIIVPFITESQS